SIKPFGKTHRTGKKRGLDLRNSGENAKLKTPKQLRKHQQEWKKKMAILLQGNVNLKNWRNRSVPWSRRILRSRRNSNTNPEDSELSKKPSVELENSVRRTPTYKYQKSEKGGTWFEQKSAELVEEYIHGHAKQQKKSKEAEAAYASACKDSEKAQEDFVSALQKVQDSAQLLQKSMGRALEAAIEFGREEERTRIYTQAKEKCTRPETWRVEKKIASDEKFLDCTYYPFSPEWQEKVRKELLDLAYRGFSTNADGEVFVTKKFG
ncbi:unnamed protein product, partial [Symbiodinium sp. CCMP2456]